MRDLLLAALCFTAGLSASAIFKLAAGMLGGGKAGKFDKLEGEYDKVPLLSEYERECYRMLAPMARGLGLGVLVKVRVSDMISPVEGARRLGDSFRRISAKSCDFVVCNSRMEVVTVIDLENDAKTDTALIDFLLGDCGIKVIRGRKINAADVLAVLKTRSIMASAK